jgi:hypothetical protein
MLRKTGIGINISITVLKGNAVMFYVSDKFVLMFLLYLWTSNKLYLSLINMKGKKEWQLKSTTIFLICQGKAYFGSLLNLTNKKTKQILRMENKLYERKVFLSFLTRLTYFSFKLVQKTNAWLNYIPDFFWYFDLY